MSNAISWGKIYESTWWGDSIQTAQSIDGSGTDVFNSQFEMRDRAIADNGQLESTYCLSEILHTLANIQ